MKKTFIILTFLFSLNSLLSQVTITSVKSGNWNDNTTWNTLTVPSMNDNVTINSGDTVSVDSVRFCGNLNILNGSALKSDSSSVLYIQGNWINDGNYISHYGAVIFDGTSTQLIMGNIPTTFFALEINNANGVTLLQDVSIQSLLSLTQGTLSVNNKKLTLLSDNERTANLAAIASGADIDGKISVQRYISSSTMGWRFLGSPVRTTLQDWSNDFITSGFPGSAYPNYYFCSVYSYDETVGGTSDNGYVIPSGVTDSILPGTGYWCWIGPTPATVEVTGVPARFTHTFNVSLTPDAGKNEDGWNMIANPYPSAIDWDSPSWTKNGIQDAIYIWDPVNEQYMTYINGIGVNGGSNIIPSGQAFWVEAAQGNPSLTCDENVKTTLDNTFLKSAPKTSVKLMLSGNSYKDETVICFSDAANEHVKGNEDATKLFSDNPLVPSITSISDSLDLVVNSVPVNATEVTVPVRVKTGVSGIYNLTKDDDFSLPMHSCLFLEDKLTGAFLDLKSAFSYTFFLSDTTTAPRFLLHISRPLIKKSVDGTCYYKNDGQAIASMKGMGQWNFEWKDALGNVLTSRQKENGCDTLKNLAPGYYYVHATGSNSSCSDVTEEIAVNRASAMTVHSYVQDNNCRGQKNGLINAAHVSGGTGPYYYKWSTNSMKPVIQNLQTGVYTLVLIDSYGCTDTSYHSVKTISDITADFKIENDTTSIFAGQPVAFTNQSPNATQVLWTFGNSTSSVVNPVHKFLSAGSHTIQLTVSDSYCSHTAQKVIRVKNEEVPASVDESDEVLIYNNGDSATVKFNLKDPADTEVTVYAIDGKIINSRIISSYKNTESISLGDSHGIYIVSVTANGTKYNNKIIK